MHLEQRFAGHHLFADGVEQAIDGQDEEVAVQAEELVAPVTIGAIDPQAAGFGVSIRVLPDDLPPRQFAQIAEEVTQRPRRLQADECRAQQARRGHGPDALGSIPGGLYRHAGSVGGSEQFWPISSSPDRRD